MSVDRPIPLQAVVSVICDALTELPSEDQAQVLDTMRMLVALPAPVQAPVRVVFEAIGQLSTGDQRRALESARMILGIFSTCPCRSDCTACELVAEFVRDVQGTLRADSDRKEVLMTALDMPQKIMLLEILRLVNPPTPPTT